MGVIFGNGIHQSDLATLVSLLATNFNGVLAKLDADATVTGTNYVSLWGLTAPGTSYETAVGSVGMSQQGIYSWIVGFKTNFNGVLTKLDADTGVADTNYNSTLALSTGTIAPNGLGEGQLVAFLNNALTNLNALNAKLDADGTVTDTNYAATWNVSDTVNESGAVLV